MKLIYTLLLFVFIGIVAYTVYYFMQEAKKQAALAANEQPSNVNISFGVS